MLPSNARGLSESSKSKWQSFYNKVLAETGDESLAKQAADSRTKASAHALRKRLLNG